MAFTWSWPGVDPATIDPTTVTVSRDPCGRWYVSFAVDAPDPDPFPAAGRVTGVDLGIKDFAVTSDGQRIANPRHLERKARNLARYQRRMARCQRGSANRAKARAKVARAHRKVRAARADFLHKASTRLVRGHDVIAVEDLAAKNILAAGLAVAGGNPGHACGADVRHSGSSRVQSAVKQEPQGVSPGIPVLQGGE